MQKLTASTGFGSSKPSGRFVVAALSLAAAMACGGALAQRNGNNPNAEKFAAGRILVMPNAGMPDAALDKILGEHGGGKGRRVGKSELRIVDLPPGLEKQLVEKLARHPHIKFAELDRMVEQDAVSNDPYLGSQWHLPKIRADVAWDSSQGSGVTVAILDSGVDTKHPDLATRLVAGYNFVDGNTNVEDVKDHGTKVAGSAAAELNNGIGVASVAGQVKIMPLRVSDSTGYATWSRIASAINYAADRGVRVANVSFNGAAGSSSVLSAANYMKSKGGLVFVSAGNSNLDPGYANTSSVVIVAATTSSDAKASFSNFGDHVHLSAPGEGIYTTNWGQSYASVSGTSFSAPIAAGVAALVMAVNPSLSSAQVESILFNTAVDLGAAGRDVYYGYGRVDAAAAVESASKTVSAADTQAPMSTISAPLGSSTVSGLVPVDVSASDNVGVAKVELRVNGSLVGTDTASPFAFSWDSTKVANGSATLAATACDAAGNCATSPAVTVTVSNVTSVTADTTAPTVAIGSPGASSTLSGTVTVSASASDNVGVAKVEFYVNGSLAATDTASPYSFAWDTTKLANGGATLTATAYDAAVNRATSSAVGVSVSNTTTATPTGDSIAPNVSLVNPRDGASVSGNVGIEVGASDNSGVSGLSITLRINGVTVAASTNSSKLKYGWQSRNAPKGANLIEAIARDAAGNSRTISATVYR
jgi:thermitase